MSTEFVIAVLDRVEGDQAVLVLDEGGTVEVDVGLLPDGAGVGAVLRLARDGAGVVGGGEITVDEDETRRRRDEAQSILDELRRRDPGGDVVL